MNQKAATPYTERIEPDFFPPGAKVCFVCVSSQQLHQKLKTIFQSHGFLTTGAENQETAAQKLRLNQYQAIVLEDGPDYERALNEINTWPGTVRRDVNLILMGNQAPSLHQQQSFAKGANFYLNTNDLDKMDTLINQVIEGHKEYYQPWNQAQEVLNAG